MAQPSGITSAQDALDSANRNRTVSVRANTSAETQTTWLYERSARKLTRTAAVYFRQLVPRQVLPVSRPLVEMHAQFVDRGEAHQAFRHLGLDRTVGKKRIGHAVDNTRFQHHHLGLILHARGRGFGPRGHATTAPLR